MSKKDNKKAPPPKQQEKRQEEKTKVNFEELIFSNLSNFRLSYDNSGYYFTDLNLANKNLEGLSNIFNNYKTIQNIDLSNNGIIDFTLRFQSEFIIMRSFKYAVPDQAEPGIKLGEGHQASCQRGSFPKPESNTFLLLFLFH